MELIVKRFFLGEAVIPVRKLDEVAAPDSSFLLIVFSNAANTEPILLRPTDCMFPNKVDELATN